MAVRFCARFMCIYNILEACMQANKCIEIETHVQADVYMYMYIQGYRYTMSEIKL